MGDTAPSLSSGELRALRLRAQLLAPGRARGDAGAVAGAVWPQAQVAAAAALAVRARSAAVVAADVERARLDDRTLVRTWAMRGTLHLLPAADLPWVLTAVTPAFVSGARRWFARRGLDIDPDAAVDALVRALAAEGEALTRGQAAQRLGWDPRDRAIVGVLHLAALRGQVVEGPERDGEPAYVLLERWLGRVRRPRLDLARATLARRYLLGYGPAAAEDLAAWSGIGLNAAREALASVRGECVALRRGAGELWALRESVEAAHDGAATGPLVRLLGAFDPWLLGWRGRDLTVHPRHARRVLPGGGMLKPVVAVDGRVVALWSTRRRGAGLELAIAPFGRVARAVREGVEAEAADLARFLATPVGLAPG